MYSYLARVNNEISTDMRNWTHYNLDQKDTGSFTLLVGLYLLCVAVRTQLEYVDGKNDSARRYRISDGTLDGLTMGLAT